MASAGSDFPASLGGQLALEGPGRLRATVSLGCLPRPYVDAINALLVGVKAYDRPTADLIAQSLGSSLIWRTHLGWRPFRKAGFYLEGGYGLVALGGGATAAELVAGLTGQPAPQEAAAGGQSFSVSSRLHMLDVEFGWSWRLGPRWRLRAAVGGAFTVASRTRIEARFKPRAPRAVEAFAAYGEAYLDDIYTSYVFTPVVGASVGYAIF
ncbi:MAG: hypothetical protein IPL40_12335 [Proteobacteria bacterium]|nr:hypothetical protein [Pseudomonadota bacterium]